MQRRRRRAACALFLPRDGILSSPQLGAAANRAESRDPPKRTAGASFNRGASGDAMVTWKLWTRVPTVALWEAVALVLDLEPTEMVRHPEEWQLGPGRGPLFLPRSFPSQEKQAAFAKALNFAERATNVAGPIFLRTGLADGMNKRTAQVSLSDVVAFLVSCEWPDIPAPLLALVESVAATTEPSPPEQAPQPKAPPLEDWKMRVQAEAAAHWLHLRKLNCNPTKHSILPHLAKWCRENNIRTAGPSSIHPHAPLCTAAASSASSGPITSTWR